MNIIKKIYLIKYKLKDYNQKVLYKMIKWFNRQGCKFYYLNRKI